MSRMGGSKGVSNHNYIGAGIQYDRARLGGTIIRLKAGAAVKLGEVVYMSADETVLKTATAPTHHDKVVGVVVGGHRTAYQIIEDSTAYNVMSAAEANEEVLIQIDGICYAIVAAAIAVGVRVVPDTATAGRIKAATALSNTIAGGVLSGAPGIGTLDATVDAGGTAVTSSAANGAIATVTGAPSIGTLAVSAVTATPAGDSFGFVLGKMIEASTAGAQVKRILLNIQ